MFLGKYAESEPSILSVGVEKPVIHDIVYVDDDADPSWYDATHVRTIQEGIDNATAGDTVFVYNGTYYENIDGISYINLTGENRYTTIIDGGGTGTVINRCFQINISGFTIRNSGNEMLDAGIKSDGSNNRISNCIFYNCESAIKIFNAISKNNIIENCCINSSAYGIYLTAGNCFVKNCSIYDGGTGVYILGGDGNNNTIENCNIFNNNGYSLNFQACSYNTITNCNISNNEHHFKFSGGSEYNIVSNSTISNPSGLGFFICQNSNFNRIINNSIINNEIGILITDDYSNEPAIDNIIYHNTFANNVQNAHDICTNFWYNSTLQEGNYWDDYTGTDANGDGIGDTPHPIPGGSNQDLYPLGYFQNIPPIANFTYIPSSPTDLEVIQFTDTSTDSDGVIVNWTWDFDDGNISYLQNPTHQYADDGTYLVNLTVMDNDYEYDSLNRLITVTNVPPEANFTYSPLNPTDLDTVQFTDSSYDLDGDIVNYTWDFDDGNVSYEQNPTHQYGDDGAYHVTLIVKDDDGATDSISKDIIVSNVPPVADANGPYTGSIDYSVHFDGSGSYDADGTIVSYDWNFGDGHTGIGVKPSHRYDTHGTYDVTLTVTDDDGFTDTDDTTAVITHGNPPSVRLIYPTGGEVLKDTVTIEWSAHDSKDGDNLPIHLFYSDGETWVRINDVLENTGEYDWDTTTLPDGTYELLIQAVDSDGNIGHDSSEPFEIDNDYEPDNQPPEKPAKPSGPISGRAGEEYTYSTSTTDPDGDQVYYKWYWADKINETSDWIGPYDSGDTVTVSHIWDEKGDYNIKVKAKDVHGDESSWSDPLSITMPKNKAINPFMLFLERLIERFPILEQILQPIYDTLVNL